ncbi:MAG: 23S rRNA (uracil(1939)-C(5))-methyltransferase RlmD [Chiayiivirga sp.]|uniref:23S rRNA (uracil(1939)-C(5))-methyltransferase RlmD n=1 Tax=Chiayiivirga sp. TaxID=2041042 RepID=UPI0025BD633C|nr:23S rRNA (uracil(1939)-C(5))-methyltransferase RlmD [Chiayiivirga sp.]MCI1709412.1 23S rRNA (uracil(1939)-C(5))-methyltransferase RlmD [Chiayiivirga sp.]MCI1730290.1 23S rRNA (uracil(1939)-C(5))-methyltransferase RlmD [Chiayiivirga sp.]
MARSNRKPVVPLELELDVLDLSHDGRGVARLDGKAVFVSGALPGERVRARQTLRRKSFDEAVTLEVLRASADRVEPRCHHFGVCGGCALQHLEAGKQIEAKQRVLLENLERLGHVRAERVLPPLRGDAWGYRRKARLGAKWVAKKEKALVGFREIDGRFIADIARCEVLIPAVGTRIAELGALVGSLDAREQIAQIELAAGDETVVLVFRNLAPLGEDDRARLREFGRRSGIQVYLQPGDTASVHPLDGSAADLRFALPAYDVDFEFRPLDFIQVNGDMNRRMVDHALALLDPQPGDRVLDLFCGLGNFTLPLARRAASVVGVEGEAGLVQRARDNARRNRISNVEFHAADLTRDLRGEAWAKQGFDKLLLDPPRTGADAAIGQLPLEGVGRIVYVSCHPGSLARDAGILVREQGYRLKAAGVMDMFPHTAHVESVALFERD